MNPHPHEDDGLVPDWETICQEARLLRSRMASPTTPPPPTASQAAELLLSELHELQQELSRLVERIHAVDTLLFETSSPTRSSANLSLALQLSEEKLLVLRMRLSVFVRDLHRS